MPTRLLTWAERGTILGLVLAGVGAAFPARAQDIDANLGNGDWQRYDWLAPSTNGGKVTTTAAPAAGDPFKTVSQGSLWQDNVDVTYTRSVAPGAVLSYETGATMLSEGSASYLAPTDGTPDDLTHHQKAALQLQPVAAVTVGGNVHDTTDDAGSPASASETHGAGLSAEGRLPGSGIFDLGLNADTTTVGTYANSSVTDDSYDAQWKQPLGRLPVTAVVKGHYEETGGSGDSATRLPSLEQSLVWKPADTTTLQMGLRQQHYQEFPGVTNELNETLFADWAQALVPDVTWHSYAEVLNTRGTQAVAPAAITPSTSGANGTPQSDDPTNTLTSSFSDETVTFSTGPSFKLDQDVSASIEYSDRFDRNPSPGDTGQEQRLSVSLKGTF